MTQQCITQFVLFAQLMQKVTFSLLHLELEFTDIVLFQLHFASDFDQGTFRVFLQTWAVNVNFFLAMLAFAFGVGKFHFNIDRAAFYRVKAYVDIVDLKHFGLLVMCTMDKKDVFREVRVVTAALFRLLLLLRNVNSQILIRPRSSHLMGLVLVWRDV